LRADAGWKRLWRRSYSLGLRWVVREAPRGWRAGRVGFARLLVPLDPWRYYELGRVADQPFSGRCLDVSSPKLLPSLLQAEGKGEWTCIDLFEREIAAWRTIDPALELDVQDATALPYADGAFDHCICVSVLEHVGAGKDAAALAEMWRVLRPGGTLHLTADVAAVPQDVFLEKPVYGEGAEAQGQGVFFKREYGPDEIAELIAALPWEVQELEWAAQRRPGIERWFYDRAPWSYAAGPFLRLVCPGNFVTAPTPAPIERAGAGVVYARLAKPAG
jgi:SAM-dependent methyltransferase